MVVTDFAKNCAGTYRVTVENISPTVDGVPVDPANPQCARFNDLGKPDGTQPITRRDPVGGAIDEIGETDTFTFEGQQGETVEIVLMPKEQRGTFAQSLHWALFGPDFDSTGSNAVSDDCTPTCDDSGDCTSDCSRTLGSAGVYTIEVFDSDENATGGYTLTLNPQDTTTTTTTPTTTTSAPSSTTTTTMQIGAAAEQTLYELAKTLRRTPFSSAERLGTSLASDGNQLVIGAPGDQTQGGGAAFVLNLTDTSFGHLDSTLYKPGGSKAGDDFGKSVALLPDSMVAVGAPGADDTAKDGGEVYLYGPGSPVPLTHPSFAIAGSEFGTSLFVTPGRNELFVGAPAPGRSDGRVFLFTLRLLQRSVESPRTSTRARRRRRAPLDRVINSDSRSRRPRISLPSVRRPPAPTTGRVFLFDRRTGAWQILQSPTPTPGDGFGSALAYVNSTLFIGAPGDGAGLPVHRGGTGAGPVRTSGSGGHGSGPRAQSRWWPVRRRARWRQLGGWGRGPPEPGRTARGHLCQAAARHGRTSTVRQSWRPGDDLFVGAPCDNSAQRGRRRRLRLPAVRPGTLGRRSSASA